MTDILQTLADTIKARAEATAETSYTKSLLAKGAVKCAEKLGEEAIETVIAGACQSDAELTAESADLLFHLLVLLQARGVAFEAVLSELERRMGTSGIEEKANRL